MAEDWARPVVAFEVRGSDSARTRTFYARCSTGRSSATLIGQAKGGIGGPEPGPVAVFLQSDTPGVTPVHPGARPARVDGEGEDARRRRDRRAVRRTERRRRFAQHRRPRRDAHRPRPAVARTGFARLLQDERQRVLEQALDLGEELRALGAVGDAMVGGERDLHHLPHDDRAVAYRRRGDHGADAEDRRLRRLDDADQRLDAVSAEVRDRKRAVVEFLRPQMTALCACDEILRRARDLR